MRSGQASHLSAVTGADAPSGDPSLSLGNRGDQVTWSGDRDARADEPVRVLSKNPPCFGFEADILPELI